MTDDKCHLVQHEDDVNAPIPRWIHSLTQIYENRPPLAVRIPPTVRYLHLTVPSYTVLDPLLVDLFRLDHLLLLEINGGKIGTKLPPIKVQTVVLNYHESAVELPKNSPSFTSHQLSNCCYVQ